MKFLTRVISWSPLVWTKFGKNLLRELEYATHTRELMRLANINTFKR